MDENENDLHELVQYINLHEQNRADLEDKVRKISRFIADNFEQVLGKNDQEARGIVCSIHELMERLEQSHNFLENGVSTWRGRLFVQKVLFVVTRIQKYVADLASSDLETTDRKLVTWACTRYCEVLSRYATQIQTI